jgi:hypothetical protein
MGLGGASGSCFLEGWSAFCSYSKGADGCFYCCFFPYPLTISSELEAGGIIFNFLPSFAISYSLAFASPFLIPLSSISRFSRLSSSLSSKGSSS